MLFTDNDVVTAADLSQIDGEIQSVADTSRATIEGAGSLCEQAWRECGQRITAAQQIYSTYLAQPGMTGGHMAAVLNTGIPARTQPRLKLNQIVAHDHNYANSKSAVQIWVAYTALSMFYRDASLRLGKDRYEEKMDRYKQDALTHWRELRASGLPMIYQELEAPGAKHSFNAGSWAVANLSAATSGGLLGGQFLVAVTWYDSSRYVSQSSKGNAESAPSEILTVTIAAGNALKVDITSLNPPTGAADPVGTAQGTWLPLNATHWNIWAGPASSGILYLQKESIAVGTKSYTLTADPITSSVALGRGQFPDMNLTFQNLVMRG